VGVRFEDSSSGTKIEAGKASRRFCDEPRPARSDKACWACRLQRGSMSAVCAFALVLDDQSRRLLCRRRKDGKWNLGGQCEAGESPWRSVTREVREELALQVRVEQLCGVYSVPRLDHVVLAFICQSSTTAIRPAAEIDEVGWFERGDLPGKCVSTTRVGPSMRSAKKHF
jgi:ADP-ribose pyrophosphatase YjhB (NUDIX family)